VDKAPQSTLPTFGNSSSKNKNPQKNWDITETGILILFPSISCQAASLLKFFLKQEFPDIWNGNPSTEHMYYKINKPASSLRED